VSWAVEFPVGVRKSIMKLLRMTIQRSFAVLASFSTADILS